jgi:hypothetical protein
MSHDFSVGVKSGDGGGGGSGIFVVCLFLGAEGLVREDEGW